VSGPLPADVHVPKPIGQKEEKARRGEVAKRGRAPLYVYRKVVNAAEIAAWCRANGFPSVRDEDSMHVTVTYSKDPVDWLAMGEPDNWPNPDADGNIKLPAGGPRVLESFGGGENPKVIVLAFASNSLSWRHRSMRDKGASWKWPDYTPHITLSADAGDFDFEALKPYSGEIILGPEVFEPIDEDWNKKIVEKGEELNGDDIRKASVDAEHGLVFGFAIVSKVNGEDFYDSQRDPVSGEPRADHIPEESMVDAALDFAKSARLAKQMHEGDADGMVPFLMPITKAVRDYIVANDFTGLFIGMHPSPEGLEKFKKGDYRGFSIGGNRIIDEEVAD
jgi:hypothetical protein